MCARFPNRPHPEPLFASDHWIEVDRRTFGGQARRRRPGERAPMLPRVDVDAWRLVRTGQQDDFRPLGAVCIPIRTCDRAPRWALSNSFASSHRSFVSPTCPATARGTSRPPYGSMPPPSTAPLPPDLRDELETVCQSLEGLQRARYLAIASLCCAVYDYSLTLDQEVRAPSVVLLLTKRP